MSAGTSRAPHGLREALRLAPHLRAHLWVAPTLLLLGLGAALAETAAVGLGALFLFAAPGRRDALAEGEGLLAAAWVRLDGLFEGAEAALAGVFLGIIC